jgi:trehalose 6-phosphate synthase
MRVDEYKKLNKEIEELIEDINWRHHIGRWRPIVRFGEHVYPIILIALYRLAKFCIVSSLHDGMNLVAKEFVSSRVDEDSVLILSRFTGAARELTEALLVNPYSADALADAIYEAVNMPQEEQQRRMSALRAVVKENNIYSWAANIVSEIAKLASPGG